MGSFQPHQAMGAAFMPNVIVLQSLALQIESCIVILAPWEVVAFQSAGFPSHFFKNLELKGIQTGLSGDISTWVPQVHAWKNFHHRVSMPCLSGGSKRVAMFYLFGGRKVSKIGLLCLCVTKAVWKNWGLRASILHKGTTSSGTSLGPIYIQGIC